MLVSCSYLYCNGIRVMLYLSLSLMAVPGLLQSNNIVPAPGNMDIINQSFYTDTILLRTILGIIVLHLFCAFLDLALDFSFCGD